MFLFSLKQNSNFPNILKGGFIVVFHISELDSSIWDVMKLTFCDYEIFRKLMIKSFPVNELIAELLIITLYNQIYIHDWLIEQNSVKI